MISVLSLRWLFVIVYLVVDALYGVLSRPFYESYARAIQGRGFSGKKDAFVFIVVSYLLLALAWWFLVAERIDKATPITRSILYASILALGIYGVFNATLYVIFDKWDYRIVVRDTLWGLFWLFTLTMLYAIAVKKYTQ